MKIACIISHQMSQRDGIADKIATQVEMWTKNGAQVKCFAMVLADKEVEIPVKAQQFFRGSSRNVLARFLNDSKAYGQMAAEVRAFDPDLIYMRWEPYKFCLKRLLISYPSVCEINGDDRTELKIKRFSNFFNFCRYAWSHLTWNKLLRCYKGFSFVTYELREMHKNLLNDAQSVVVPNGIALDPDHFCTSSPPEANELPRVVFLGSNSYAWHGLEKLKRVAELTRGRLEFDLFTNDKSLVWPDNVEHHGFVEREIYGKIVQRAACGLGPLEISKSGLKEACSLKIRNYLGYGTPAVCFNPDTAFIDQDPWFFGKFDQNSTAEEIAENLVHFANKVHGRKITLEELVGSIDSESLENRRLDFLRNVCRS